MNRTERIHDIAECHTLSRLTSRSEPFFQPLRLCWGVLYVRFDHPQEFVDTARDLSKQIRSVSVIQGCRIIDGFTCASSECRHRILHRPHVSSPLADLQRVFAELSLS
jgi:hypothetical protein